jgi:hypothetical protein
MTCRHVAQTSLCTSASRRAGADGGSLPSAISRRDSSAGFPFSRAFPWLAERGRKFRFAESQTLKNGACANHLVQHLNY